MITSRVLAQSAGLQDDRPLARAEPTFLALGLFFLVLLEAPSLSFHGPLLGTLELAFLRIGSQFAAQILFGTVFLGVFGRGVLAFFVLAQLETQRLDDWGLFQRLIFHF